jgi:hypothetical protein
MTGILIKEIQMQMAFSLVVKPKSIFKATDFCNFGWHGKSFILRKQ